MRNERREEKRRNAKKGDEAKKKRKEMGKVDTNRRKEQARTRDRNEMERN